MDFSLIANEHLHVRLEAIAALFLVACALPPLAAFLTHLSLRPLAVGPRRYAQPVGAQRPPMPGIFHHSPASCPLHCETIWAATWFGL